MSVHSLSGLSLGGRRDSLNEVLMSVCSSTAHENRSSGITHHGNRSTRPSISLKLGIE